METTPDSDALGGLFHPERTSSQQGVGFRAWARPACVHENTRETKHQVGVFMDEDLLARWGVGVLS